MSATDQNQAQVQLLGRISIRAKLRALSGLSIGGGDLYSGCSGLDQTVVRDPITREPYVPGSSLKGKMRSLTERALGLNLKEVERPQDPRQQRFIHLCGRAEDYQGSGVLPGYRGCPVCHLYGSSPRNFAVLPTRLLTRDAFLHPDSRVMLLKRTAELPFTEVKTETLVDRISAASTPRQRERVPAGAVFEASWSLACYSRGGEDLQDHKLLALFFAGLALLEDDYLGGQGSRGYGRVAFEEVQASVLQTRALSPEAAQLLEGLKGARTVAEVLKVTGNPMQKS
ncbi:MAG: type III-A CRISPR-associated RAMP protein Csm3 [Planctomycetes bacterium]|nr:type III-A CRISPR-associated RAMP protein Csm3 [Planctomycetota bacterium]